jgi:hypothetical protein
MLLDTTNKNIYGIGVGISMVFEILGHFLFKGAPYTVMIYIQSDATSYKKQIYIWFRGGDLNVFRNIWACPV